MSDYEANSAGGTALWVVLGAAVGYGIGYEAVQHYCTPVNASGNPGTAPTWCPVQNADGTSPSVATPQLLGAGVGAVLGLLFSSMGGSKKKR